MERNLALIFNAVIMKRMTMNIEHRETDFLVNLDLKIIIDNLTQETNTIMKSIIKTRQGLGREINKTKDILIMIDINRHVANKIRERIKKFLFIL
jgi:hypothetical protein